jgi:hypothetical protein
VTSPSHREFATKKIKRRGHRFFTKNLFRRQGGAVAE